MRQSPDFNVYLNAAAKTGDAHARAGADDGAGRPRHHHVLPRLHVQVSGETHRESYRRVAIIAVAFTYQVQSQVSLGGVMRARYYILAILEVYIVTCKVRLQRKQLALTLAHSFTW
jgi:hypothetical protein